MNCHYCGDAFKPKVNNQIYCSKAHQIKGSGLIRRGFSGEKDQPKSCSWCGDKHTISNKKFCSDDCNKKAQSLNRNSKRRARLNNVPRLKFDLLQVINRDGCDCHYCGISTTNHNWILGTHINIDHIIPVSKGGHHAIYNAQILCRLCNNAKGNQIYDVDIERAKELWPEDPLDFIRKSKGGGLRKDNKSGVKGVFFDRGIGKWLARIELNKKRATLIQTECKHTAIKYKKCADNLKKAGVSFEDIKAKCKEIVNASD